MVYSLNRDGGVHLVTSLCRGSCLEFLLHLIHFLYSLRVNRRLRLHIHAQDALIYPGVLLHALVYAVYLMLACRPADEGICAMCEAMLGDAIVQEEEVLELEG